MEQAILPSQSLDAWEQLHGRFNAPKGYIPPFMQKENNQIQEEETPEQIKDKLYDMQVELEAKEQQQETRTQPGLRPRVKPADY